MSLTTVSSANLCDATGAKILSATITFQPCDNTGKPLSFAVAGGGQASKTPVFTSVANGVFSIELEDSATTTPANVSYLLTAEDNAGRLLLEMTIQPTGPTWSLDTFNPTTPNLATQSAGLSSIVPLAPAMTPQIGAATVAARADHVHPSDVHLSTVLPIANGLAVSNGVVADTLAVNGPNGTGHILAVKDAFGFKLVVVDQLGKMPIVDSRITLLESEVAVIQEEGVTLFTSAAAGVAPVTGVGNGSFFLAPSTFADGSYDLWENNAGVPLLKTTLQGRVINPNGDVLSVRDAFGFKLTVVDGNGKMPIVDSRISALETEVSLLNSEVSGLGGGGSTAGVSSDLAPIAGTSVWPTNQVTNAAWDTIQGFISYQVPVDSGDFQVGFNNAALATETPGPGCSIKASIEYPIGTFHPLYFQGKRSASIDGGAVVVSDKRSLDIPVGGIFQIHYQFVRNAGDTTPFPASWTFGSLNGAFVLAPYTNTRGTGNRFEAVETLITRTITDLSVTAGSTTATSASAAFTPSEVNQTIKDTTGTLGWVNNTAFYSFVSPTQIVLSTAPTVTATGVTAVLSGTDKTLGQKDYYYLASVQAPSPWVVFGRPRTITRSFLLLGDSITYGLTGTPSKQGSWAVQGLNFANASASGTNAKATAVLTALPYMNASQVGETFANLAVTHDTRLAFASRCKYTLGMLGSNDLNAANPINTIQVNAILLWRRLATRGTKAFYSTIIPRTTSTDTWTTLTNQTPFASETTRVAFNTWMRDGAPIDINGNPLAVGTIGAIRAAYYNTAGVVTPSSGPASHFLAGVFDLAGGVESSLNSGLWRVDLGDITSDGEHPDQVGYFTMAGVLNALLPSLP
jgi:hypothetical protein